MTEEYWANTQLSPVRHFGSIVYNNCRYVIVNKEGKDIFECSEEADRTGRKYAIEPGEPCDLCHEDFVKTYRRLGRERFLAVLKEHPQATDKELKKIFKELWQD